MGVSQDAPTMSTLERVLALEEQVRELRRAAAARAPSRDLVPRLPLQPGSLRPAPTSHPERRREERRGPGVLDRLSRRERDVLELMGEGCSNAGIALRLHLSERTVEATTAHVFRKLGLEASPSTNRRVLAVLTLLRCRGTA